MYLKPRWVYDQVNFVNNLILYIGKLYYGFFQRNKRALPPKKRLQCVFVRGLLRSWKTPIFFGFDYEMTKQNLLKIVFKLEEHNIHVRACSFDLGKLNIINSIKLSVVSFVFLFWFCICREQEILF